MNAKEDVHMLRISSVHTSFPDTGRINGHVYDSVLYDAALHYSDSSVLIAVPKNLSPGNAIDIVFWFHGWRNNIDSADKFFHLTEQFIASKRNAVLVLAETAKNSPDSYGGKLEQAGMFKLLVNDVTAELKKQNYISPQTKTGNITLAGHSGAYRVIAYILQNGGLPVHQVFLFDALYSQVDKFTNWIKEDSSHRFIHWYTNQGGGTDEVSEEMMKLLKEQNISFKNFEETTVTKSDIQKNRIVFIHSLREHNEIIYNPNNFQLLLETGDN